MSLPKQFLALLDQYNDEDLAKMAEVEVEVVRAAREGRQAKKAVEPAPEPAAAAAAPTSGPDGEEPDFIRVAIPPGADRDALIKRIDEIVREAAVALEGAPRVVKYIGNEKTIRHPDTGKRHTIAYGDVLHGTLAAYVWHHARHLVREVR